MARLARAFPVLLLSMLLVAPFGSVAQDDNAASPVSGRAQVIAQGASKLPDGEVVWQVEVIVAGAEIEAAVTGPAFIVTGQQGVLLSELDRVLDVRLAPGEAHFLPGGFRAAVWSLSSENAEFQVWSIVASGDESEDALFVSEPFAAPSGMRDLNLVRDVLDAGDASQIDNGELPALLLAAGDRATAVNANGGQIELAVGTPDTQTGSLTVTATGDESTTLLVASIGPELATPDLTTDAVPDATPVALPNDGPGAITLVLYACPAGVSLEAAAPETCVSAGDETGRWSLAGDSLDGPAAPVAGGGGWTWTGLAIGDYRIVLDAFPDQYATYAIDLYDFAGRDGFDINVALTADQSAVEINAYFLDPQPVTDDPDGASLGLFFYDCPPETTTTDLTGSSDPGCTEVTSPFAVSLASDELLSALDSSDLVEITPQPSLEGAWEWTALPPGAYTLTIEDSEPGDAFYVQRPCGDQSCPQVGGLGSSFDLAVDDAGFTLIIYRIPVS